MFTKKLRKLEYFNLAGVIYNRIKETEGKLIVIYKIRSGLK